MGSIDDVSFLLGHKMIRIFKWSASFLWISFRGGKKRKGQGFFVFVFVFFFLPFVFLRAPPMAYGGSQARGLIGAAAAGLRHSHGDSGS